MLNFFKLKTKDTFKLAKSIVYEMISKKMAKKQCYLLSYEISIIRSPRITHIQHHRQEEEEALEIGLRGDTAFSQAQNCAK